jgi:hypothetical protein
MIALNIGFFHTLQSTPSCSTNATVPDQFTAALSTAVQVLGFTVICGIPFGMVVSACQTEECVRACSPWHHVPRTPAICKAAMVIVNFAFCCVHLLLSSSLVRMYHIVANTMRATHIATWLVRPWLQIILL